MKKLICIFTVVCGITYLATAQSNAENLEKARNYKAQNNRLSPGADEPIVDGIKSESTIQLTDNSYKNQFPTERRKNKNAGDLFFLPGNSKPNETGFYAAGYGKSGFRPTRRKVAPAEAKPTESIQAPGTAQEKPE